MGVGIDVGAGVGVDVDVGVGVGVDVGAGVGVDVGVDVAVGCGVTVGVGVGGMLSQAIDKTIASTPTSNHKPVCRTGLRCFIGRSLSCLLAADPYYTKRYDCWQPP